MTNGKIIRLLVEDEPFDVRYGELRSHERVLDLRAGVLRRSAVWVSPAGTGSASPRRDWFRSRNARSPRSSTRSSRSIAAFPVVVQSELVANEPMPDAERRPPRGRCARSAARSEYPGSAMHARVLVALHECAAACRWPPRWTT